MSSRQEPPSIPYRNAELRSAAHIASLLGILISLVALLGHLISTCSSSYSCYRLVTRYCAPERPWMWSRAWCRSAGGGPAPAMVWGIGLDFDGAVGAGLLRDLAAAYHEAMWPTLVGPGDARQRRDRALDALSGVIGAHRRPLLLASDQIFHGVTVSRPASISVSRSPACSRTASRVGSLASASGDHAEAAELLFNTVC